MWLRWERGAWGRGGWGGWQSIDGQPLGDVPTQQGGLLVCHGSHRLRAFAPLRASYGEPLSSPAALARVPPRHQGKERRASSGG
jgi:hypothetical protein